MFVVLRLGGIDHPLPGCSMATGDRGFHFGVASSLGFCHTMSLVLEIDALHHLAIRLAIGRIASMRPNDVREWTNRTAPDPSARAAGVTRCL